MEQQPHFDLPYEVGRPRQVYGWDESKDAEISVFVGECDPELVHLGESVNPSTVSNDLRDVVLGLQERIAYMDFSHHRQQEESAKMAVMVRVVVCGVLSLMILAVSFVVHFFLR